MRTEPPILYRTKIERLVSQLFWQSIKQSSTSLHDRYLIAIHQCLSNGGIFEDIDAKVECGSIANELVESRRCVLLRIILPVLLLQILLELCPIFFEITIKDFDNVFN